MKRFLVFVSPSDLHPKSVLNVSQPKTLTAKIVSCLSREPGWHYGDGGPSPQAVVHAALVWDKYLRSLGLNDIDAFPGDSGEILLSAIHGDHSIDVILEIDGFISVAYDRKNVQQFYKSHVSENEAQGCVATLARIIWSWSAGYTAIDLTPEKIALPVLLLETPGTTGAYQSQNVPVYIGSVPRGATKYVSTPGQDTWTVAAAPLAILPYIGDSTRQFSRGVVS